MLTPNQPCVNSESDTRPQDAIEECQWRALRARELLGGAAALLGRFPDTALARLIGETRAEVENIEALLAQYVAVTAEAQRQGGRMTCSCGESVCTGVNDPNHRRTGAGQ